MSGFASKLSTVALRPAIGVEYVTWLVNSALGAGVAVRIVQGVKLGDFGGFSEYHSVAHDVSTHELDFIRGYPFAEGTFIDVGANLDFFRCSSERDF